MSRARGRKTGRSSSDEKGVMNMTENPFHLLAVMKKVAQTDRKVIDCYRFMYKKALWDEAAKRILIRHQLAEGCVNEAMIEQLIQALRTNTLHVKKMKQNTPIMNELVQQVMLLILNAVFHGVHGASGQTKTRHDVIRLIQNQQGKFHTFATGCFSKDIQHLIHRLFHEKIADNKFFHLLNVCLFQLEKQTDKTFLSSDLLSFIHEICHHSFDRWMKKHDKDIYYQRFEAHFFIGLKDEGLNVKQCRQKIKQFTEKQKWNLQTWKARQAKRGIHFLGYKLHQGPADIALQCDIPNQSIQQFIQKHDYGRWQTFTARSRPYLLHLSEEKIIQIYNRELCTFASRYKLATNFYRLRPILYLARKSLLQTIARKRNRTPKQIIKQGQGHRKGPITFITYPQLQQLSKRIN